MLFFYRFSLRSTVATVIQNGFRRFTGSVNYNYRHLQTHFEVTPFFHTQKNVLALNRTEVLFANRRSNVWKYLPSSELRYILRTRSRSPKISAWSKKHLHCDRQHWGTLITMKYLYNFTDTIRRPIQLENNGKVCFKMGYCESGYRTSRASTTAEIRRKR